MSNDSYHDINVRIQAEHRRANRLEILKFLTTSTVRILVLKDVQKATHLDTEVILNHLLEFKRAGWLTCTGDLTESKLLGIELTDDGKKLAVLFL